MDKVKNLIELLNQYKDALPPELVTSLELCADCDEFERDADYYASFRDTPTELIADGQVILAAVAASINPVLRRITRINGAPIQFKECLVMGAGGRLIEKIT